MKSVENSSLQAQSVESLILLSCIAIVSGGSQPRELMRLRADEIRWTLVLEAAEKHALLPILHMGLKHLGIPSVPQNVLKALEVRFVEYSRAAVEMVEMLHVVLDRLERKGIHAVAFKGPVLAERYYSDMLYRTCGDIDLWIPEADIAGAHLCLQELEFYPCPWRGYINFPRSMFINGSLPGFCHEYAYLNEVSRIYIDLHWHVLPPQLLPLLANELLARHVKAEKLWNRDLRIFSDEMTLIIVCVHACKHGWAHINHLLDVVQICRRQSIDWNLFRSLAEKFDALPYVTGAWYLCEKLLGVRMPEEVSDHVSFPAKSWYDEIVDQFLADPMQPNWRQLKKDWIFVPAHRLKLYNKAALFLDMLTRPSLDDYRRLPLPSALFPFYRALRPLNIVFEHGPRIASRLIAGGYDSRLNLRDHL